MRPGKPSDRVLLSKSSLVEDHRHSNRVVSRIVCQCILLTVFVFGEFFLFQRDFFISRCLCVLKKPVLIATLRHIVLSFSFLSISLRYRPQNLQSQSPLIIMDFYYLPGSAPCRAVQMTAAAVGVELNLKLTDLMKGEHMKPEFLKVGEPILGSIFFPFGKPFHPHVYSTVCLS